MEPKVEVEIIPVLSKREKREVFLNESRRQAILIAQEKAAKVKANKEKYGRSKH